MDSNILKNIEFCYDSVAEEYTEQFFHELDHKPLDKKILELFADRIKGKDAVFDVGCGPGHITSFLNTIGVNITGVDISQNMVVKAKALSPHIDFKKGDMQQLPATTDSIGGIVGFYAIVNLSQKEIINCFHEFHRVLKSQSPLLISFHIGDEMISSDEFLGKSVHIEFYFYQPDSIQSLLEESGFVIDEVIIRNAYADHEYPSKRAYLFAHK